MWKESKPPTKPFRPTTPSSTSPRSRIAWSRSSTTMPASSSTSTTSSRRLACQSWLPSTVSTGVPSGRQASARIAACSGSPCVVRSPASRMTSTSLAICAKAVAISARWDSRQCRSPTAAIRAGRCCWGTDDILPVLSPSARVGNSTAMREDEERFGPILATLRKVVALLREAQVPFMVGGSLAAWARGGPDVTNDLDLMVRPADAERVLSLLVDAGMTAERPPEEWLLKAWDGDVLVDVIFQTVEGDVTDELLARGEELTVTSMAMNVLRLEDMFALRLQTLNEHRLDYAPLLKMARALREQVDWNAVRARVRHT